MALFSETRVRTESLVCVTLEKDWDSKLPRLSSRMFQYVSREVGRYLTRLLLVSYNKNLYL